MSRLTAGFTRRATAYGSLGVLLFALSMVCLGRPLGDAAEGDEWYYLGANLAVHSTLGIGDEPSVFRPPGYPAFVAVVLRLLAGAPREGTFAYLVSSQPALYAAQALVLAGTFLLAALWWSRHLSSPVALAAAAALCLNPLALVLVGLPHYAVVHIALLLAGAWALEAAADHPHPARALFAAGLFWGVIALVRPVSLLLPPLVPLLLRGPRRAVIRHSLIFAAGMALAIAPWSLRNASVRGRFVPVSAQGWTALWGSTVEPLPVNPNHLNWYLVTEEYSRIVAGVAGGPLTIQAIHARDVDLEDAFRREALANIRARPSVYLGNAARSVAALSLCTSGLLVKAYEHVQRPGTRIQQAWLLPGHPQDFEGATVAAAFVLLCTALLPAAIGGGWLAWRRRDRFLLAPLLVFGCVFLAHAITYMDLGYYYIRLPVLILLAFYGLEGLNGCRKGVGTLLAAIATVAFLAMSGALLAVSVWPPLADIL
jgi:hypothetical protein